MTFHVSKSLLKDKLIKVVSAVKINFFPLSSVCADSFTNALNIVTCYMLILYNVHCVVGLLFVVISSLADFHISNHNA